ncbi:hypothetical protein NDU88_006785 [Pleurodeles waltl]|uniref:Uncharacterized protein n=1 Tax=Pleurodeles waltl TaxID=8319 RepID=A0AAV7N1V7_PLEWA|nr:hypothetical protein NDU88_006785 [Pleurodeles waltl]
MALPARSTHTWNLSKRGIPDGTCGAGGDKGSASRDKQGRSNGPVALSHGLTCPTRLQSGTKPATGGKEDSPTSSPELGDAGLLSTAAPPPVKAALDPY